MGRRRLLARGVAALAVLAASACSLSEAKAPYASAPADWNPGAIAWQPYTEGLAAAKAQKKPVCLVFYTDWCPHCHNYSQLFHAPEIVALATRAGDGAKLLRAHARLVFDLVEMPDLAGAITPAGDVRTLPSMWAERGGLDGFYIARLRTALRLS